MPPDLEVDGARDDVDHRRTRPRQQMRNGETDQLDGDGDVEVEGRLELLGPVVEKRAPHVAPPRAVDDDVEAAELSHCSFEKSFMPAEVGDVRRHGNGATTRRRDLRGGTLHLLLRTR